MSPAGTGRTRREGDRPSRLTRRRRPSKPLMYPPWAIGTDLPAGRRGRQAEHRTSMKAAVMSKARRKARSALRRAGLRRPAPHALGRIVFAFARARPNAFFIQVGSNDGKRYDDPLADEVAHRNWHGILIEPVP